MSYTGDLLDGLAQYLAAAGVGVYRADGVFAATDTAIVVGVMPSAPDRVVCLTAYPVTDDAALTDTTTGVQVRTRTGPDPRTTDALDDAAFDVLQGASLLAFGAAQVRLITRVSGAPMGADAAGRIERSSNYYVRANRPALHLA